MMTNYANGYGRRDEPEECYHPGTELACPVEWLYELHHDDCLVCESHGYVLWRVMADSDDTPTATCPCCKGRQEHFWGAGMDADGAICQTCNGFGLVRVVAPGQD